MANALIAVMKKFWITSCIVCMIYCTAFAMQLGQRLAYIVINIRPLTHSGTLHSAITNIITSQDWTGANIYWMAVTFSEMCCNSLNHLLSWSMAICFIHWPEMDFIWIQFTGWFRCFPTSPQILWLYLHHWFQEILQWMLSSISCLTYSKPPGQRWWLYRISISKWHLWERNTKLVFYPTMWIMHPNLITLVQGSWGNMIGYMKGLLLY